MSKSFWRLMGALLLLVCSSQAFAAYETRDSRWGENTLVYDSNTGIEWLRVDLTYNISWDDVVGGLSVGGLFEGLALGEDDANFASLFEGNGFPLYWSPPPPYSPELAAQQYSFLTAIGGAPAANGVAFARGRIGTSGSTNFPQYHHYAGSSVLPNTTNSYYTDALYAYDHLAYSSIGTWLHVAPVPEPSTYALMLLGLVALGAHVRRRSAQAEYSLQPRPSSLYSSLSAPC